MSSAKNKRARKKTNEIEIVPSSTASPRRALEARRAGGGTLEGARHAGQGAGVLQRPARRGGDASRRDPRRRCLRRRRDPACARRFGSTPSTTSRLSSAPCAPSSDGRDRRGGETTRTTRRGKRSERRTTGDVSGTVSGAARPARTERLRGAGATRRGERSPRTPMRLAFPETSLPSKEETI